MKKAIWVLILTASMIGGALAQSPIARFKFEDAEQAFADKKYADALIKLEEAEQEFGKINPPILYLRVMVRSELLAASAPGKYDFTHVELARADAMRYLEEYSSIDSLRDQAREVYRVSENLKKYPQTRAAYDSIVQQVARREAKAAEKARKHAEFVAREYKIGDTGPAGGLIFYDRGKFMKGWRYLEMAPPGWSGAARDPEAPWGCPTKSVGETQRGMSWGGGNTAAIIKQCKGETAAALAASYSIQVNGIAYNDWFLPTVEQLTHMWQALHKGKFKHSLRGYYWSSSQGTEERAIYVYKDFHVRSSSYWKTDENRVRPIRFVTDKR